MATPAPDRIHATGIPARIQTGVRRESDAYKDTNTVMENQTDLVTPVHTLRQIVCVKG